MTEEANEISISLGFTPEQRETIKGAAKKLIEAEVDERTFANEVMGHIREFARDNALRVLDENEFGDVVAVLLMHVSGDAMSSQFQDVVQEVLNQEMPVE